MPTPSKPDDAIAQIDICSAHAALDTASDERFDVLARLAKRHFEVTTALITLNDGDQHYLKSCAGFSLRQTADAGWFSQPQILDSGMLVVTDTTTDSRADDHPLVMDNPSIRFYARCPLEASNGELLGAFWLLGDTPRDLNEEQREFLRDLARLVAINVERDSLEARLRKEADVLRESEKRMALAIAGSGTGIWDRNIQTDEIHYSPGWKSIIGYTDHEVSNRIEDSYTRVHPDDLRYVRDAMQAHFAQQTASYSVEHRLRCKDGSYKWVSSRGKVISRDSEGNPVRMIGTTTDISTMHTMSEQLQQSVDLITNLTNEVPGLVFQYQRWPDGKSRFGYASAGIRDMYEVSAKEVAVSDAAINAIIHPDDLDAYRASLESSAASLAPWHLEYRVLLPSQGLRWRQGAARPQRLADGSTLWHGFITDVTERKRIETELQEFATTDFLTQLPNRRHFMGHIDAELKRIQRGTSQPASVLMFDLDHFKLINDTWGHAIGDLALKHFSTILHAQLRKTDLAGRVGGEEFAAILNNTDVSEAIAFARRVQHQLAQTPLHEGTQAIALTVSIGIAVMTESDASVDAPLSRSDLALYQAKEAGRNRIEIL